MHHIHHIPAAIAILMIAVLAITLIGNNTPTKRSEDFGVVVVAIVLVLVVAAMSGCALQPTSVRLYAEHVSHATQHVPIADISTQYGYNTVDLELHWQRGPGFLDLAEGYNLNGKDCPLPCYGALEGPREVFHARIGLELPL
jgi:hypothetical protein